MINGGYQILNFNGVNINNNEKVKIVDIFTKLNTTNKAVLVSGLAVNGVVLNDFFVQLIKENNTVKLNSPTFVITIDNEDNISITQTSTVSPIPVTKITVLGDVHNIPFRTEFDIVVVGDNTTEGIILLADNEVGNIDVYTAQDSVIAMYWGDLEIDLVNNKAYAQVY